MSNGLLTMRVTNNGYRYISQVDADLPGYNGLASLQRHGQFKNIFVHAGLNYECGAVVPKTGAKANRWNAPRVAPMTIEHLGEYSVKLTQKGADAAGINMETIYTLGETHVDMSCTMSPDRDVTAMKTFWASYINQVQNTSLYLRAKLEGLDQVQWLEAASPYHGGGIGYRAIDPKGKRWHEFSTDNPVLRQVDNRAADDAAKAAAAKAQEGAGFRMIQLVPESFENFWFGLIDDHILLLIMRPSDDVKFGMWLSPTAGGAVRSPAWDFSADSRGPVEAGKAIRFEARMVYKPYAGIEDVMKEVKAFQKEGSGA